MLNKAGNKKHVPFLLISSSHLTSVLLSGHFPLCFLNIFTAGVVTVKPSTSCRTEIASRWDVS
jgi:hypothetical protein